MAAAATADGKPGSLALLKDKSEGRSYLVDTGSAYSILSFSSTAQPTGPALTAASDASIKAWGLCRVQLSTGGRPFSWKFLQADVAFSIIGADFLANFKMAVDLSGMQLLCPAGLKILMEAPRAGSLTASAIGVVEAPSPPSLSTVEALSTECALPSSPTLPTVEALGDSGSTGVTTVPPRAAKRSPVAKEVASVALEVEPLMAEYPSVVNDSKKLPKAKHQVKHIIETMCPHHHPVLQADHVLLAAELLGDDQLLQEVYQGGWPASSGH